jgi:hypothetical protein
VQAQGLSAVSLLGGVGIVAMGSATGLPACIVLGGLGALVGNRIGVERDKPLPNVFAINRANSHNPPVLIPANAFAAYRPARDMVVKGVGCFGPTPILQAIVATAKLIGLGCVYA